MGHKMKSFKLHLAEASGAGGYAYEDKVNSHLKKHGLQDKNQKSAGASKDAPDGTIHASGKHHNLEIKKDSKAMMGQIGMHHDGKGWTVKAKSKSGDWYYVQPCADARETGQGEECQVNALPVGIARFEGEDGGRQFQSGDNLRVRLNGIDEGRGQLSLTIIN